MLATVRAPAFAPCQAARPRAARQTVVVRADGAINPSIQKDNAKVVDTVVPSQLEKPMVRALVL